MVICKSWKWAALVYVAARVVALTSNNSLGALVPQLATLNRDDDSTTPGLSPLDNFLEECQNTGITVDKALDFVLYDIDKDDHAARVDQSQRISEKLILLKRSYRAEVARFLGGWL